MKVRLRLDGELFDVTLEQEGGAWVADVDGERFTLSSDASGPGTVVNVGARVVVVELPGSRVARLDGRDHEFEILGLSGVAGVQDETAGAYGPVHAPMTGKLESIAVEVGQEVQRGDVLFILEAMKMRNQVKAAADGRVTAVHGVPGSTVDTRTAVVELGPQ